MSIRRTIATRLLIFVPFTIPLIFLQKLPIFYHSQWWVDVPGGNLRLCHSPLFDLIGDEDRTNVPRQAQGWIVKALEYAFLPRIIVGTPTGFIFIALLGIALVAMRHGLTQGSAPLLAVRHCAKPVRVFP